MATRGETEGSSSSPELSTKLSFEFLEDITNNFSQIFCEDSYGTVYKGTLPDSNKEIAVKKLKQKEEIAPDNFENQLQSIVGLKHENIVEVFGFCNETLQNSTERLLCYGFSPSENLEQHLFDTGTEETEHSSSTEPSTNWDTCFKIIKGICQGLLFLHKQLDNNPITHMDLNLKNIWLDKAMVPKIANVELSKIISQEQIRKESWYTAIAEGGDGNNRRLQLGGASKVPDLGFRGENPRFDPIWLYLVMTMFLHHYLMEGIAQTWS
ncbi:putative receptor-like protein kinase At4g00960 isoform X3 [Hordeum vulgare subsp. vulgare]|nr:putative receptor-like protein kinase At4g00960 isoform X3 [Hordeum vulgare subsp. vulgare]